MIYTIVFISATVVIVFGSAIYRLVRGTPVPPGLSSLPGPKGLPLIGSILDVPNKLAWLRFAEWSRQFGPMYQVNLAGTNHIWISSDRVARELLSKRASKYSDRPHIPALIADNRSSGQYLPLMNQGGVWVRQRRFASNVMRVSEKLEFGHFPELESVRMCKELLDSPNDYAQALESYISRITCRLAWGHSEASDELKQRARELLLGVSPNGALGNRLPFLMTWPDWLSPPKAWERRRAQTERQFFETMQNIVQEDIHNGVTNASWSQQLFSHDRLHNFSSKLEGAYAIGMHGIAGALTIAAPMQTFLLAICHHPQYLPPLHEELDRVCPNRLPTVSDKPRLPFLRAVIKECMRWRPPVPTGIPHYASEDDEYNGYFIPKGSVVHALEWSIVRDPILYPNPEEFNPYRWLKAEYPTYKEPLTEHPSILNMSQFGYGRRTCQGQSVAEADLLVGIGSIAWAFDISKCGLSEVQDQEKAGLLPSTPRPSALMGLVPTREGAKRMCSFGSLSDVSHEQGYQRPDCLGSGLDKETELFWDTSDGSDSELPVGPGGGHCQRFGLLTPPESDHEEDCFFPCVDVSLDEFEDKAALSSPSIRPCVDPPGPETEDDTLKFSTLLIAKPTPFKLSLRCRSPRREAYIRARYQQEEEKGEWVPEKEFWGPNQGRGCPLGWGKV